jgi:hypothetical protein
MIEMWRLAVHRKVFRVRVRLLTHYTLHCKFRPIPRTKMLAHAKLPRTPSVVPKSLCLT